MPSPEPCPRCGLSVRRVGRYNNIERHECGHGRECKLTNGPKKQGARRPYLLCEECAALPAPADVRAHGH